MSCWQQRSLRLLKEYRFLPLFLVVHQTYMVEDTMQLGCRTQRYQNRTKMEVSSIVDSICGVSH